MGHRARPGRAPRQAGARRGPDGDELRRRARLAGPRGGGRDPRAAAALVRCRAPTDRIERAHSPAPRAASGSALRGPPLPVVASVPDQVGEPRYASLKGIMAARRKTLETWSLADLGLSSEDLRGAALTRGVEARPPRAKAPTERVENLGPAEAATRIADWLTAREVMVGAGLWRGGSRRGRVTGCRRRVPSGGAVRHRRPGDSPGSCRGRHGWR